MVYIYIRQVPGFAQLVEQKHEIFSFLLGKELAVSNEVVEYANKNLPIDERKEFELFLQSMPKGSTVIVSSLGILSDKAEELIKVINCVLSHEVNLWIAQSNTLLNKSTSMVDIFPLLNRLRQSEHKKTKKIGRPKGSKSSSKFDSFQGKIFSYLREGLSVSAIARSLEVSRSSLKDYIESRDMKTLANSVAIDANDKEVEISMDNALLICPFEQEQKRKKVW